MSRYPQRYGASPRGTYTPDALRTLDPKAPTDLANELWPKVRVSCILSPEGIIWNRYKDGNAISMCFNLQAIVPLGYKMRNFELDLSFAPAPQANSPLAGTATTTTTAAITPGQPSPSVWLLQEPSRSPLPDTSRGDPGAGGGGLGSLFRTTEKSILYKWQFRSYPVPDDQNVLTNAKWIWESNRNNPQVESRGALYGAVALQYAGNHDLLLQCKVNGKLCQGRLWWKLRERRSEPALWLAKLGLPSDDFEDYFKSLKVRIEEKNTVGLPRE